jgi:protein phosphatase 2C family protein 2/3
MNSLDGGKVLYFGVFDGHGGAASSGFLKSNLLRFTSEAGIQLCKNGLPLKYGTEDVNPLSLSFEEADSALLDYLGTLGDPECWSGSTATVVFLNSDFIVTANVGDSRAVLGKKGRTVDISSDHRPVASSKVGRSEIK